MYLLAVEYMLICSICSGVYRINIISI